MSNGSITRKRISSGETVALPQDAGTSPKIISIVSKKSEDSPAQTTLRQAGKWKVVGTSVYFFKGQTNVTINYEVQTGITDAEGADLFGKEGMDGFAAIRGKMAASVEGLQFDKMNLESAVVKDFGENGGFKAAQNFAQPFKDLTDRPLLAKSTASTGLGLTEVSTELSSISAIAGKQRNNGVLKKISTQMDPKSLFKAAETLFPKASKTVLRKSVSGASLSPTTVVTTLAPENEPTSKANAVVEKTYNDKIKLLNECGSKLDPTSLLGGIGRSKQNAFAHLVSKAKAVVQGKSSIGDVLADLKTNNITAPSETFKNLISNSQTNIRGNLTKGDETSNAIKPTTVFDITSANNRFSGYNTPRDYVFTNVSSPEELYLELANANRSKSKEDDAIRVLIVGWTAHLDGPPEKVNAAKIHELSKKFDLRYLANEAQTTNVDLDGLTLNQKALETINRRPLKYGIQPHYVILRNGDIQRGRPIDETRNGDYAKFSLSGLKVAFVATESKPVNAEQFASFDILINQYFKVFPGGEVMADFEIDNQYNGPGFNVKDRVNAKYKRQFIIEDPLSFDEMPSKVAQCITQPKKLARSTSVGPQVIDINSANQDIKETLNSKEFKEDLAAAQNALKNNSGDAFKTFKTKLGQFDKAVNLPEGAEKKLLDNGILDLDKQVDGFSKNINRALKASSNLTSQVERTNVAISNAGVIEGT
tara:strand:- start:9419 stop:11536 length:2118 start_codon:yes stop_codon:yes gene_type:complete